MRKMALYKLALALAKHKMPFSACEAFITFAKVADPDSIVFKNMAGSRNTIATKTVELYENILRPELTEKITNSPYWSLMADDSTDSAVQEQCGVYARFIDLEHQIISTRFLSFWRLVGHPDAENIYQGILHVIDESVIDESVIDESGLKLPLKKLVGFTCDGASVMISSHQGVLGKLRRGINPKLFNPLSSA